MKPSYITRAMSQDGSARIFAADTTAIVAEARRIHDTAKTATAVLGRALTGTSLMGTLLKDKDNSLTLQFRGDGPAGMIVCVSDYAGNVRGYMEHPEVELAPNAHGKLDVGGAVGRGMLYVIRDLGIGEPYIGMAPLVSGEIAEDITSYYASSEQTPSVCALGVRVNPDLTVKSAGGFLLQLLPGADEEVITRLEANMQMLPSVSAMIADGKTTEDVIAAVFTGIPYDIFDEFDVQYRCNCTRERYVKALCGLPDTDLAELIAAPGDAETTCRFCGKTYAVTHGEIEEILRHRAEEKQKTKSDT